MDKNFYLDLIPSDNMTKEKFMALVNAVLEGAVATGYIDETIEDAFDIYNAAGNQLDILGELVGVSRLLPVVPFSGSRQLDDDEYRLMILLKVAKNNWNGTNDDSYTIYNAILEEYDFRMEDNQDMTITVAFADSTETRMVAIMANTDALLYPAGVRLNLIVEGKVNSPLYIGTGTCGVSVLDGVEMLNAYEGLNVGEIEEMDVNYLNKKTTRKLEY